LILFIISRTLFTVALEENVFYRESSNKKITEEVFRSIKKKYIFLINKLDKFSIRQT